MDQFVTAHTALVDEDLTHGDSTEQRTGIRIHRVAQSRQAAKHAHNTLALLRQTLL
jgi:hypothetical protein